MAFPELCRILFLTLLFSSAATSEPTTPPESPHITDCFSSNMETFRCRWSRGSRSDLSEPGQLRLFYLNKRDHSQKPSVLEWLECPQYSQERADECFFNKEHTTVWNSYRVQLRDHNQLTVFDESVFHVYDRVRPDPPYNLSWSVLESQVASGPFYDIMVSWRPPESADVRSGWMKLQYQLQHREANTKEWKESDVLDSTHCSVFGLHSGVQYEVRVRSKMVNMKFGEFSETILVYQPLKVFPVISLLVFGTVCLVAVLVLVLVSQQDKLMVLMFPPIPGPKIRGIDPDLLKKGKLCELSTILGPSMLQPECYDADPWVEFIELDLEEPQPDLPDPENLQKGRKSSGFSDDDSGRASCCDPDFPCDAESSLSSSSNTEIPHPTPPESMYTQVSEVRPSGNIVLSPEDTQIPVTQKHGPGSSSSQSAEYTAEVNAAKTLLEADPCPAPGYTVVEGVAGQNALLLTEPQGYLNPDLFTAIPS